MMPRTYHGSRECADVSNSAVLSMNLQDLVVNDNTQMALINWGVFASWWQALLWVTFRGLAPTVCRDWKKRQHKREVWERIVPDSPHCHVPSWLIGRVQWIQLLSINFAFWPSTWRLLIPFLHCSFLCRLCASRAPIFQFHSQILLLRFKL